MMIFIPNLLEFITLLLLMFESLIIGYVLVNNSKLRLNQIEALNIYPFICVKCTTFWTNLIQNIILAYIFNPMFALWGLITASILAYAIYFSWKDA